MMGGINELNDLVHRQNDQISELHDMLKDRDREIERINGVVAELRDRVEALERGGHE